MAARDAQQVGDVLRLVRKLVELRRQLLRVRFRWVHWIGLGEERGGGSHRYSAPAADHRCRLCL
jgi:hypothetical protein